MTELIKNKVVVITGASSGLGEATARCLAQCGAGQRTSPKRTARDFSHLRSHGGKFAPPSPTQIATSVMTQITGWSA